MPYEDKTIVCVDCGAEFVFTAAEQQQFADKGFTNHPKRCKACREARKSQKSSGNREGAANTFSSTPERSSGGRGGYGRGGGGGGGRGGFSSGPRQMFPATCAQCGQQTEVPFKPSGSRPVYCRECFQQQKAQQ